MSLHISKHFGRPLALASATLIIHIGAAAAADSTGDIQQQAKESWAESSTVHHAPQSGPRDGKVTSPTPDAQELARQLLLGSAASRGRGAEMIKHAEVAEATDATAPQKRRVAYGDAQAAAQQLLLGQHPASDAPQSGPRDGKVTSPTPDAQELARQLLLGSAASRGRGAEMIKHAEVAEATGATKPRKRPVADGGAQAAAQ